MKIKCPDCEKNYKKDIRTYHYEESGLDSVYIEDTPVYHCPCGTSFPSIFKLSRLNNLISEQLLQKPSLLTGKEIRFLRKSLFLSSKAFADLLGVGKTTLSKWENDHQKHSEINDRLIRTTYMITKGVATRKTKKYLSYLSNLKLEEAKLEYIIVASKMDNDYVISLKQIASTQDVEPEMIYSVSPLSTGATANPLWTYPNSLDIDPSLETSYDPTNIAETSVYAF